MGEWAPVDYGLLGTALAAQYADVETTKGSLRRGDAIETNPLLGENPSSGRVNAAGGLSALGTILAANALPARYRRPLLAGLTGMSTRLAYQNKGHAPEGGFAEVMKKPLLIGLATAALAHYGLPMLSVDSTPDGNGVTLGFKKRF